MAYTRRATSFDATWARAWTADAVADLTTLQTDGLPRHGDVAYVTATTTWYLWRDDGTWFALTAGGGTWGSITGTLSSQTDLNTALGGKAATSHTHAEADVTGLVTDLAAKSPIATVVSSTLTGAQNNWAPTLAAGQTLVEWNGASDVAFTGLVAGVAGQRVTVKNITAAKVATFAHQSGISSAGNKFRCIVTSGPTPIAAGGSISFQYDGTDWQLVGHLQGAPITRAYAAGNYTTFSVGTWTVDSGDVAYESYIVNGKWLTLSFFYQITSVSGGPTYFMVLLPGGFTHSVDIRGMNGNANDNGAALEVLVVLSGAAFGSTTKVGMGKLSGATWAAATNNTYLQGQVSIPID